VIAVARGAMPASLDGPSSVGGLETAAAVAYYSQTPPAGKKPDFSAYKEEDVRRALREMFGPKCAYCESVYAAGAQMDTEHYRPKNEVERPGRAKLRRGYYWLAASWPNLLPTCNDCNRRRRKDHKDGTRVTGKGSRFPLVDESQRALAPGEELLEEPLLLDPTLDQPDEHLRFGDECVIAPAPVPGGEMSVRGAATIATLGLNRTDLVHDRQDHLYWLELAITRFRKAVAALGRTPGNPDLEEQRDSALAEMRTRAESSRPYAALMRQRLDEFEASGT
jgi:uncharacterized protein (TIGR02646 family)